jgi:transposase
MDEKDDELAHPSILARTANPRNCAANQQFASDSRLEALLEEAHLKLSSLVSDLLGASARRMLKGIAEGENDAAALAGLADQRLRATPEQLTPWAPARS